MMKKIRIENWGTIKKYFPIMYQHKNLINFFIECLDFRTKYELNDYLYPLSQMTQDDWNDFLQKKTKVK